MRSTLVLEDLFDVNHGWPYPAHQVPVERLAAADGTPYYLLSVDGLEVFVVEQTDWLDENPNVTTRLCVLVGSDAEVGDALFLVQTNADTFGLPAAGVDQDGTVVFVGALPFAEGFPLEWLRKQLLVVIGTCVAEMSELLVEIDRSDSRHRSPGRDEAHEAAASLASTFVRAFL